MRLIGVDDVPALVALHAVCFGEEAWSKDRVLGSLALSTTRGWCMDGDDTPLGFILCQHAADEVEILTLAVHPDARRHGHARRLLLHAMESVEGARRMFLDVARDNHAAIRLYESSGFTVIGTRRGYYRRSAESVDALCYGRELRG